MLIMCVYIYEGIFALNFPESFQCGLKTGGEEGGDYVLVLQHL